MLERTAIDGHKIGQRATTKRQTSEVDVALGARIHITRKDKAISQDALAAGLGLSFQQVQKYEKGVNRISVARLMQIADFLQVPVMTLLGDALAAHEGAPCAPETKLIAESKGARDLIASVKKLWDAGRAEDIHTLACVAAAFTRTI